MRYIRIVHLFESSHNISSCHTLCIQGKDLIIKLGQPRLTLADQLGFEGSVAVSGCVDLTMISLQSLPAISIATVAGAAAFGLMLGVTQLIINFGAQCRFDHYLLHQPTKVRQIMLSLELLANLAG